MSETTQEKNETNTTTQMVYDAAVESARKAREEALDSALRTHNAANETTWRVFDAAIEAAKESERKTLDAARKAHDSATVPPLEEDAGCVSPFTLELEMQKVPGPEETFPSEPPETHTLDEKMALAIGAIAVLSTRFDKLNGRIDELHDEFRAGLKAVRDDIHGELDGFDRRLADANDNMDQDRDEEIRRQIEDLNEEHKNHMEKRLKGMNREVEWDIGNLRLEVNRLSNLFPLSPSTPPPYKMGDVRLLPLKAEAHLNPSPPVEDDKE